jgi:hypothetical protein
MEGDLYDVDSTSEVMPLVAETNCEIELEFCHRKSPAAAVVVASIFVSSVPESEAIKLSNVFEVFPSGGYPDVCVSFNQSGNFMFKMLVDIHCTHDKRDEVFMNLHIRSLLFSIHILPTDV